MSDYLTKKPLFAADLIQFEMNASRIVRQFENRTAVRVNCKPWRCGRFTIDRAGDVWPLVTNSYIITYDYMPTDLYLCSFTNIPYYKYEQL